MKGNTSALIICVLIAPGLYGCSCGDSAADKEAHSLGLETSLDGLKNRVVSQADDASPLYDAYEPPEASDADKYVRDYLSTGVRNPSLVSQLSSIDFSPIEAIASRPHFKLTGDWNNTITWRFDWISKIRGMGTLLSARALMRAQSGDAEGCANDIVRISALSKHCREQGLLLPNLIADGLVRRLSTIIIYISRALFNDTAGLQTVLEALELFKEEDDGYSLKYELAWEISSIDILERGEISLNAFVGYGGHDSTPSTSETERIKENREQVDDRMVSEFVKIFKVWNDLQAVEQALDEFEIVVADKSANADRTTQNIIIGTLLPDMGSVKANELRHKATVRGMRIGIAATMLRAKDGTWPTLAQAAGEAGISLRDPFGKDLKYLIDEKGLFIYSLHRDQTDQNGNPYKQLATDATDLVVFGKASERFERGPGPAPGLFEARDLPDSP